MFFRYPPSFAEAHDTAFDGNGDIDVEITISRINAILQTDLSEVSGRINVPTLVVSARDDCLIPQFMSDEVAMLIPQSKYVVLDEGGHFMPETCINEYNSLLDDFISKLNLPTLSKNERRLAV